eukprot:9498613-Pyramimonas_sp.AAC.2
MPGAVKRNVTNELRPKLRKQDGGMTTRGDRGGEEQTGGEPRCRSEKRRQQGEDQLECSQSGG